MKNLAQKILDVDRYDEKNFNLIKDEVRIIKESFPDKFSILKEEISKLVEIERQKDRELIEKFMTECLHKPKSNLTDGEFYDFLK